MFMSKPRAFQMQALDQAGNVAQRHKHSSLFGLFQSYDENEAM
jgi:hypothetical protein